MLEIKLQFVLHTITSDIYVQQRLCVKICLDCHTKIALVILLLGFGLKDYR